MRLRSVEPTPNPNSMKLNLDDSLPKGTSHTYTAKDRGACPELVERLLAVSGVQSLFHMADFIAVQKTPRGEWGSILAQVRAAFGEAPDADPGSVPGEPESADAFGEVRVEVQTFRGIPMLVKLSDGERVERIALPDRFNDAVQQAAPASPNMLAERRWVDHGARYGELAEIGAEVVEELAAAYSEARLAELVQAALGDADPTGSASTGAEPRDVAALPDDPDWRVRYAALEKMRPEPAAIAVLARALRADPKSSIRRLAAVYLGLTGDAAAVEPLCGALSDAVVSVRRTAGDALSDLGDPRAIEPMARALVDPNKLVRWRAARFLFEVGDAGALPALRDARDDPEFEVRMQVRLAIERIEGGHSAQGPVWRQMTRD